jgi:hypothetical protein
VEKGHTEVPPENSANDLMQLSDDELLHLSTSKFHGEKDEQLFNRIVEFYR